MKRKPILKPVLIGPKHLGQVDHLHDTQERALGHTVDRPKMLAAPVMLSMGFEDEEAKRLLGGFYVEAIGEVCFLGLSPDATEESIKMAPEIFAFLQGRGIRWVRCFIPKNLKRKLGPKLKRAGFVCKDAEYSHFAVDIRR